jgi:hypothetical protein
MNLTKHFTFDELTSSEAAERNGWDNTPNETELAKVYDQMTTKVDNTLSKDELDRITGKPIIQNSIKDLYKPLYTNYDKDYDLGNLDNVKYIYEGYSSLPFGSMI